MTARTARLEVVRGDGAQPWHARFRAANGRIVWTTEQYVRRAGAMTAIHALAAAFSPFGATQAHDGYVKVLLDPIADTALSIDVVDLDERTTP